MSVVILGAARTAIGRYGGTLRQTHPADLGARAAKAAIERSGLSPEDVDEALFGHGRQAGSGPNPARQVCQRAGLPFTVPAQTINQACASGLQSVALGAQAIMLGQSKVVLAGGIESMSRMPYLVDAEDARWGHKMGNSRSSTRCIGTDSGVHSPDSSWEKRPRSSRGSTGSRVKNPTRLRSRASRRRKRPTRPGTSPPSAWQRLDTTPGGKPVELDIDEHPRAGSTIEGLRKLPLTFGQVEGHAGIITAGSASGITDGGAALVLADEAEATRRGLKPMARIIGWATAGVDPRIMGIGPVPAVHKLFKQTGLTMADFDLVELNEAFAVQVLAVLRDLPIPDEKLNVNGGAIALGHPIGATGARILVTLLHEMVRRDVRRGLATLCVSGGLGMALAVER